MYRKGHRKEYRKGIARTLGILVVSLVVIGVGMYLVLGSPVGRPSESNRVRHPNGFSMIGPDAWLPEIRYGTSNGSQRDAIIFAPAKSEGRPLQMQISRRSPNTDDASLEADGFKKETVVGLPVLHKELAKRDRIDVYAFMENGEWFNFTTTRHQGDYDDAAWLRYLQSFRIEQKVVAATTQF